MGPEMERFYDLKLPGALVLKTLTLHPRKGNPPPRLAESPAGLLNSIGLPNVGARAFVEEQLPRIAGKANCLIVNFAGEREEEFAEAAAILDGREGIDALEINLSCPNVAGGRMPFSKSPVVVQRIVAQVRKATRLPLLAKLSPNVADIVEVADAAMQGGADGLTLINTLLGLSLCWRTRKPRLSTVFGGLSGPAIKPIALLKVHQVQEVAGPHRIPIIGQGGICSANDALEFIIAGATAVGVGTALFYDPLVCTKINAGIAAYLAGQGLDSVRALTGTLDTRRPELAGAC